jgi:hypothetical protein
MRHDIDCKYDEVISRQPLNINTDKKEGMFQRKKNYKLYILSMKEGLIYEG